MESIIALQKLAFDLIEAPNDALKRFSSAETALEHSQRISSIITCKVPTFSLDASDPLDAYLRPRQSQDPDRVIASARMARMRRISALKRIPQQRSLSR